MKMTPEYEFFTETNTTTRVFREAKIMAELEKADKVANGKEYIKRFLSEAKDRLVSLESNLNLLMDDMDKEGWDLRKKIYIQAMSGAERLVEYYPYTGPLKQVLEKALVIFLSHVENLLVVSEETLKLNERVATIA